jgi:hypothetical protein
LHVGDIVTRCPNDATPAIVGNNGPFDGAATLDVHSGPNALHTGGHGDDGTFEVKGVKGGGGGAAGIHDDGKSIAKQRERSVFEHLGKTRSKIWVGIVIISGGAGRGGEG